LAKVDRLETLVLRSLADILRNDVKMDLGFITLTGVKMTNELSFIYAYYSVFGNDEQKQKTKDGLEHAKGFIKNQLAAKVNMRKMPELIFKYDDTLDKGAKIDQLIKANH
jgi:ribosome-binding factor A